MNLSNNLNSKNYKKHRMKIPFFIIILILVPIVVNEAENLNNGKGIINKIKDVNKITTRGVEEFAEDSGNIEIFFCPREMCPERLKELIESSSIIKCAFYTVDDVFLELLINKSSSAEVNIALDEKMFDKMKNEIKETLIARKIIRAVPSKGIMHNKFCIFENKIVLTGSYNPTEMDSYYNNNNVAIIKSKILSDNYEKKFQELWLRAEIENEKLNENTRISDFRKAIIMNKTLVKNYFCPEDDCRERVIEELEKTRENIVFMTFSFTDAKISEVLAQKSGQNIKVKGIFEKKQISNYSEFEYLKANGIEVKADNNPYTMHHKVFIIDNETVITGSFNPTENANFRNDENMLIINDRKIAERYLEEFDYVWNGRGILSKSDWTKEDFENSCSKADSIIISEVYYDAKGKDAEEEFVELYNPTDEEITLDYIFLENNKSKMRLNGKIEPESAVAIKPKFPLSNKQGILFVINDSEILDFVSWNSPWNLSAEKGKSLQRNSFERKGCADDWNIGLPTRENI